MCCTLIWIGGVRSNCLKSLKAKEELLHSTLGFSTQLRCAAAQFCHLIVMPPYNFVLRWSCRCATTHIRVSLCLFRDFCSAVASHDTKSGYHGPPWETHITTIVWWWQVVNPPPISSVRRYTRFLITLLKYGFTINYFDTLIFVLSIYLLVNQRTYWVSIAIFVK